MNAHNEKPFNCLCRMILPNWALSAIWAWVSVWVCESKIGQAHLQVLATQSQMSSLDGDWRVAGQQRTQPVFNGLSATQCNHGRGNQFDSLQSCVVKPTKDSFESTPSTFVVFWSLSYFILVHVWLICCCYPLNSLKDYAFFWAWNVRKLMHVMLKLDFGLPLGIAQHAQTIDCLYWR